MFDISIANKKRKPIGNKFLASLNRKKRLEEGVEYIPFSSPTKLNNFRKTFEDVVSRKYSPWNEFHRKREK